MHLRHLEFLWPWLEEATCTTAETENQAKNVLEASENDAELAEATKNLAEAINDALVLLDEDAERALKNEKAAAENKHQHN